MLYEYHQQRTSFVQDLWEDHDIDYWYWHVIHFDKFQCLERTSEFVSIVYRCSSSENRFRNGSRFSGTFRIKKKQQNKTKKKRKKF